MREGDAELGLRLGARGCLPAGRDRSSPSGWRWGAAPPEHLPAAAMESPAGGAAAEPAHPGAEPELPTPGPVEGGGEAAEGGAAAPRSRCLRAVYVLNDPPKAGAGARSPEAGARQCLLRACEAEGAQLGTVNFGELDFGETAVLDAFYDAGEPAGRGAAGRVLRLTYSAHQALGQQHS